MFIIYITEAHAVDVWNIGESAGTINYKHKNLDDRLACIEKFQKTFDVDIPIYADNMQDEFETQLACWPFRYFVIKNKKFIKIGQPDESEFDICELIDFLEKC